MMKKHVLLLLLLLLCLPALAENAAVPAQPNPEGWRYMGYTPAGVTFLIPDDTQGFSVSQQARQAGILYQGANEAYTIQLRRYEKDQLDLAAFKAVLRFTPGAQMEVRDADGVEVVCYRNGNPTGVSELFGIALTGTDGCMYKISIFTGVDEDCSADAPVWGIAEIIAGSVSIVDYSAWPLEE